MAQLGKRGRQEKEETEHVFTVSALVRHTNGIPQPVKATGEFLTPSRALKAMAKMLNVSVDFSDVTETTITLKRAIKK